LTIGDIALFALFKSTIVNDGIKTKALIEAQAKSLEARPLVKAWFDNLSAHFADYLAARPQPRPL